MREVLMQEVVCSIRVPKRRLVRLDTGAKRKEVA